MQQLHAIFFVALAFFSKQQSRTSICRHIRSHHLIPIFLPTMDYMLPEQSSALVLCADCGVPITPNSANLCLTCLRNTIDITDGIPKQATVNFCRNCERYLNPPAQWVQARLESRELLAICLKKLRGLNRVRLIDAGFIWTEPHSKRLRIKLTVQKEVLTNTVLQQIFEVVFVVQYGQCPDCTRLAAQNTWKAAVQVRQKVPHKRTFLYLEQLILKANAHRDTVSIREAKDGLDFYYVQRGHAMRMVDFLATVVPIRMSKSEELISTDIHTSTSNYKFTYSVEIAPICKDDLIALPRPLAKSLGNIGQLVICTRVTNAIRLLDPTTLQTVDIPTDRYWRDPFQALASIPELVEFLVLDIETNAMANHAAANRLHGHMADSSKWLEADAQVSPMNAASFGEADAMYHTRTHLGRLLAAGDQALGYHLRVANFNHDAWDSIPADRVPDAVLVRKSYPDNKKRRNRRMWKLKSIAKETGPDDDDKNLPPGASAVNHDLGADSGKGAIGRRGGLDGQRAQRDYDMFLAQLEEDEELRHNVNIYRDTAKEQAREERKRVVREARQREMLDAMDTDDGPAMHAEEDEGINTDGESEWGDDGAPTIPLDELLDEMDDMHMDQAE